ncbi:MAG: trk system potassium uptake protein TrkA [bacterium]
MRIVIGGAGEVGYNLIGDLCKEEDIELFVIDANDQVLNQVQSEFGIESLLGSLIDHKVLSQAQLENTDLFIAITNSDEMNMIACQMAKEHGVKRTLCRIRHVNYGDSGKGGEQVLGHLGIDRIINPVTVIANDLYNFILTPHTVDKQEFVNDQITLIGFKISKESNLDGMLVSDFRDDCSKNKFKIALVQRNNVSHIPNSDFKIEDGDIVYFFCPSKSLHRLREYLGYSIRRKGRIFINGGGHIGFNLAKKLEESTDFDIRILEKKRDQCRKISDQLQSTLVLNIDGTDSKNLVNEGIIDSDYFIAVTDNDYINITSCLLTNKFSVKNTICLVRQQEYVSILENTPIDLGVSPRNRTALYLSRFIHGEHNITRFIIRDSHVEVLQLNVEKESQFLDVPIQDIDLEDSRIAMIYRNKKIILPAGNDTLQTDDILLITVHGVDRKKIVSFFKPSESITS